MQFQPVYDDRGRTSILSTIRDNARVFFYVLLVFLITLLILAAILTGWLGQMKNGGCCPTPVCNVTCPTPVCNVTCPTPIFNGTVDFNGTVTVNGSSLIVNETACNSTLFQEYSGKPCSVLMYDPVNQQCAGGDGSITKPDGSDCNNLCFSSISTLPTCQGGKCKGDCRGRCDASNVNTCGDIDFANLAPFYLSMNITINKICAPYGGGTFTVGTPGNDFNLFGAPANRIDYFVGDTPISIGNCLYEVSFTRYIDSIPYANINETIIAADSFCNGVLDHSSTIPTVYSVAKNCLETVSSQGFVLTNSGSSPYTTKTVYLCAYQFICSRRDPIDDQQYLIM